MVTLPTFIKKIKDELIPVFKELIASVVESGITPKSWTEAHITLIPKEQQDMSNIKKLSAYLIVK